MPHYEYTRWDGSQQFQPQSADKVFDQIAEYLLHYGEHVLRDLDALDDEEMPEILELIQKEGLIEKDDEGKWQVSPKGLRRIQESALETCSRRSTGMRSAGTTRRRRGRGPSGSRTRSPTSTATRWRTSNLHETLKNACIRQGGGLPIRLHPTITSSTRPNTRPAARPWS